MSLWSVQRPVSSKHSPSLHPSPCQLSRKCLPLVTGGTRRIGSGAGSVQIHHLSKPITQAPVLRTTKQQCSLSRQRWGRYNKQRFFKKYECWFSSETLFFFMLKINVVLARDGWRILKVAAMVMLRVGGLRSSAQVNLPGPPLIRRTRYAKLQHRAAALRSEAETSHSSWTNAGGHAVFMEADSSLHFPGW